MTNKNVIILNIIFPFTIFLFIALENKETGEKRILALRSMHTQGGWLVGLSVCRLAYSMSLLLASMGSRIIIHL
jgi:hypothetical protein